MGSSPIAPSGDNQSQPLAIPLAPMLGAEIKNINVAGGATDNEISFIHDALNQYSVVVLRNQRLSPKDQVDFATRIGPLRVSFFKDYAAEDVAELTVVSNIQRNGKPIGLMDAGALWHTDGSYLPKPDMYTVLYSLTIPERDGVVLGDTLFTSTTAAYESLPAELKTRIAGKYAIHSLAHNVEKKSAARLKAPPPSAIPESGISEVRHPIVRAHPNTGQKCLYVSEGHTKAIADISPEESRELLEPLLAHIVDPRFIYRHKWQVGDLLIWDNCSTQHLAITDYGDIPRRLHRAGIQGPVPV